MPLYEYEHTAEPCELGKVFEHVQMMSSPALTACPQCGAPVKRLISRTYVSSPKGDSDLKSRGFSKLVKRDDGVYENVTRQDGESRYVESGKPETMPDFKKRGMD